MVELSEKVKQKAGLGDQVEEFTAEDEEPIELD
jgi:hypothetical protein